MGTMLPKRVLPGKQVPSHMGVNQKTIQNLEIIKVDMDEGCILVKGSIPGPKKSLVIVKSAIKTNAKKEAFDFISYETKEETPKAAIQAEEVSQTEEI
jgi:large subunit ribosomal protein L3